jgi:hypothetical protein
MDFRFYRTCHLLYANGNLVKEIKWWNAKIEIEGGLNMKMSEALKIINKKSEGYMVSFEWLEGGMLRSDCFPDKHSGEKLINTEAKAWELAYKFALKMKGRAVNIYVTDSEFNPVLGYEPKMIINR